MIADAELAAAVAGRAHWRVEDDAAVYAPPGAAAFVRVRPVARPSVRERYHAAVIRVGVAESSITERSAAAAVYWSERRALT
jgi:hypothetical protein